MQNTSKGIANHRGGVLLGKEAGRKLGRGCGMQNTPKKCCRGCSGMLGNAAWRG